MTQHRSRADCRTRLCKACSHEAFSGDAAFPQLIALDSTLGAFTIVLDNASASGIRYGNTDADLVPYLADSTLFRDASTGAFFVIDPGGNITHRFRHDDTAVPPLRLTNPRGFDPFGNAIMPGTPRFNFGMPRSLNAPTEWLIVRANFEENRHEELARYNSTAISSVTTSNRDGVQHVVQTVNPLPLSDDWTVSSDGTLVVVRARDYRVDMLAPNATKAKSVKLPYSKRKLTDADKHALMDSVRVAMQNGEADESTSDAMGLVAGLQSLSPDSLRKLRNLPGGMFKVTGTLPSVSAPEVDFPPLKEIPDYLPPFRKGALKPDRDANVWIATNAQSSVDTGDIVYDVVNNQARLVQHVRVPAGRSIVGFGPGGVVYLKYRTTGGWMLERVRVVGP